jgi:hypothetical protein
MKKDDLTTVTMQTNVDFSFDKDKEMGGQHPAKMELEEENGAITFEMKESS